MWNYQSIDSLSSYTTLRYDSGLHFNCALNVAMAYVRRRRSAPSTLQTTEFRTRRGTTHYKMKLLHQVRADYYDTMALMN